MNLLLLISVGVAVAQPGTLEQSPELAQPQQVEELAISGTLDAKDYEFLKTGGFDHLRVLDLKEVKAQEIPPFALAGSTAQEITLPATLASIGEGAFEGSAITVLTAPAGLKSIGVDAFRDCKALKSVNLSTATSLTDIADGAFADCPAIASIELPGSIQQVGRTTFDGDPQPASFSISPAPVAPGKIKAAMDKANASLGDDYSAFAMTANPEVIVLVSAKDRAKYVNSPDWKEVPVPKMP